jgi:D-serine deaminase-like pyridoxal phosphate-dependent protein
MATGSIDVNDIEDEFLDGTMKGLPGHVAPFRLRDIAERGWNVAGEDLPLPLLTLREPALRHNVAQMQEYCRQAGVSLAPHGKTTMAPQLFKWQLDAGAWGMTAATVQQLQVYRRFGCRRVLFANQLVGRPSVRYVLDELRRDEDFDFYSFVDSEDGVRSLDRDSKEIGLARPLQVLAEVGYVGGRAGVRDLEAMDEVVEAIRATDGRVRLVGVAGFEGLLASDGGGGRTVAPFLESVGRAVDHLIDHGDLHDAFIVTAGGSAAFDQVVEAFAARWQGSARVMLRSGCYMTHDHGMYASSAAGRSFLRPALELWAYVQSIPEPELAILSFGRRDAPHDSGLPVPLWHLAPGGVERRSLKDCSVIAVNDQHAYLRLPASSPLRVGDRVVCGISHPCTAFDKWKVIPLLDERDFVIGAVRTYF